MANTHRGELSLALGPQTYRLRLTTNAVCELEDFAGAQNRAGVGRTWDQVLQGINRGSLKDLRLFFWVALRAHHPELATEEAASLHAIGDLIDEAGGMAGLIAQITALMAANAPPSEAATSEEAVPKAPRPRRAQAGTGGNSKPTPLPSA